MRRQIVNRTGRAYRTVMVALAVVTAPAAVQRARVLARPGMSEAKFAALLAAQVPDAVKRARADFVIDTGAGLEAARQSVERVIATLVGDRLVS